MASSKENFCRSEDDVKAALGIVKSYAFDKLLIYSRSEYLQRYTPTAEQVRAINDFVAVMCNLPEEEVEIPDVGSELKHDLTPPDRSQPQPETKK